MRPAKEWSERPEAFPENLHTNPENQLVIIVLALQADLLWKFSLGGGGGKYKLSGIHPFQFVCWCSGYQKCSHASCLPDFYPLEVCSSIISLMQNVFSSKTV